MRILITGASRGIGYDTALKLAANKEHTVFALSRNVERLKDLQAAARQLSGTDNLQILPYDLENPEQDRLLDQLGDGPVDLLINNAGLLINKPFSALDDREWRTLFEVNFFGVVRMIRLLLPLLEKSKHAHILNVSSMGGIQGSSKFPGLSGYSASKAAVANLTECLAEEFKDKNIAVNCLALGAVQTDMLAEAFPGYKAPLDSNQMADFMVWFGTEGQRFFNGKILPVSISTP